MAEKRPAEPAAAAGAAAEGAGAGGAAGGAEGGAQGAPDEDELRAAKRRALEEAKRAALARILEGAPAAGGAQDAPAEGGDAALPAPPAGAPSAEEGEGEDEDEESDSDGDDDDDDPSRPVATLDIVKFLRREQEAAVGQVLGTNASTVPGVIVQKEAVMQRRVPKGMSVPKAEDMVGGGAVVAAPAGPKKANLPKGARPAHKAAGSFLWAGAGEGGVSFDANRQRQQQWRPPPASLRAPVQAGLVGAVPPKGGVFTNATLRAHIAGGAEGSAAQPAAPPGLAPLRARFQAAPKRAGW